MQEGSCAGLRLLTRTLAHCGTGDVEITTDDAGKSGITLNSLSGVADLGAGFAFTGMPLDTARLAAARYGMQTAGAAGHSYAVKLSNGEAALLTIASVRKPGELSAAARKLFRANAARILRRMGGHHGPAEPEDVADADGPKSSLFLEIMLPAQ